MHDFEILVNTATAEHFQVHLYTTFARRSEYILQQRNLCHVYIVCILYALSHSVLVYRFCSVDMDFYIVLVLFVF